MGSIIVNNLDKGYKHYPTRWSRLREWLHPRGKTYHHMHWVLQGISFEVRPGEAVGIIGINGAGKSTLLKMIVGTTRPTSGSIHVTGRVAAMLELGMGFHPDFTGRQNVFMAGQLLGYSVEELTRLMPEIEAFAEIGEYIDQPVRVYSSGMQMRLAFSVATATRPDVLIVDEALSVGDTYFQHKSFDRIRSYRKQGTTLLIVSHDKNAIQSICDRAILLNAGKLAMEGEPEAVMDYYTALLSDHQAVTVKLSATDDGKIRMDSGTREAEFTDIKLINQHGQSVELVAVGEPVIARLSVRVNQDIDALILGFGIKDRLGQMMFGTNTWHTKQAIGHVRAGTLFRVDVEFAANLGAGSYSIHCSLVENESRIDRHYHWIDRAKIFEVVNMDKPFFVGCLWNELKFKMEEMIPASSRDGDIVCVS